ncbi:MAG TPA: CoA transferase [Stellaceae bacterium]|nr:CoA transferase [Stellaceae bacterium]
MTKPFAGIRILDFTRYVAGPFGTYQMALLGADVIKIEPKTGDEMRHSQLSKEWAAKSVCPLSRCEAEGGSRTVEGAASPSAALTTGGRNGGEGALRRP